MTTRDVTTFLALLAVVAQAALVLALALLVAASVSDRARRLLARVRVEIADLELPAAWLVAAVATGGSLYFSEVAGFVPCQLCWYQRYLMYPLVVLLALAQVRRLRRFLPLLLPVPLAGLAISSLHHYIERHPSVESQTCRIGVPCSVRWVWEFGYISIPVLAGTAFVLIALLVGSAALRGVREWRGPVAVSAPLGVARPLLYLACAWSFVLIALLHEAHPVFAAATLAAPVAAGLFALVRLSAWVLDDPGSTYEGKP